MNSKSSNAPLLLFLVAFMLTSCFNYEEVEIKKFEGVEIQSFSQKGIKLKINARISNPNNFKITIVKSDLNLFVNNNNFGKANLKNKIVLKPKTEAIHAFEIDSDMKQILNNNLLGLLSLFTSKQLKIKLDGTVKAKAYFIKKTFPFRFEERVNLR